MKDYYHSVQISAFCRYVKVLDQIDKVRRARLHETIANTATKEDARAARQYAQGAGLRITRGLKVGDESVLETEGIVLEEDRETIRNLSKTISKQCGGPPEDPDEDPLSTDEFWAERVDFLT